MAEKTIKILPTKINSKSATEMYMEFFKDKNATSELTNDFVRTYRQKSGGYIDLAEAFNYYNYILDNIEKFKRITGLSEDEILHPGNEPNQKWHLMVSYLGRLYGKGYNPRFDMVTCPELWLWMFEVSDEFNDEEIKK